MAFGAFPFLCFVRDCKACNSPPHGKKCCRFPKGFSWEILSRYFLFKKKSKDFFSSFFDSYHDPEEIDTHTQQQKKKKMGGRKKKEENK